MSPSDAQGRELLTPETERALARQAAVAALTAIGQFRTAAEADAGSSTGFGSGGGGVPASSGGSGAPGSGALGSGALGSGALGSGALGSGASGGGAQDTSGSGPDSRIGRPAGFSSPERAIRRNVRGNWASRG